MSDMKINCYGCGKFRVCKPKTITDYSFLSSSGNPKVVNLCKQCYKNN